jgi:hypothetical protein
VRSNAHRFGEIGEPQGEIDKRISVLQKCSTAGFGPAVAPSLLRRAKLILSGPHSGNASQLTAFKEATQLLNVTSEAMIVSDYDLSVCHLRRAENPVDTAGGKGQRALTQDMHLRLERAKNMGLVKVVRGRDDYRIELVGIEKLIDVRKNVRDTKTLSERACFGTIVVAYRNELGASDLRQDWQMRELRNRAGTNKSNTNISAHSAMRPTVVPG